MWPSVPPKWLTELAGDVVIVRPLGDLCEYFEAGAMELTERDRAAKEHADTHYAMGRCDWCNRPAGAIVTDTDTENVFQTCEMHVQHTYDFAACAWVRQVHGLDNRKHVNGRYP